MKFADNDILGVSNLNRFRASLADLGMNKAVLSAYQVWETNPFAEIGVFPHGITPQNIEEFLLKPRLDVLVEEMDALPLKILIREAARKHRIPVVMVTGNGAGCIIDVERFDKELDLPLMSGYLKKSIIKEIMSLTSAVPFEQKVRLARDFMGKTYLVPRLVKSFELLGKTLASIPQLAEASYMRGATVSYFVRQIITGQPLPSGRYVIQLEKMKKM